MRQHGLYKLNSNNEPVPVADFAEYANVIEHIETRRVGLDFVNGCTVSTVFLGLEHGESGGKPILFETMVFTRRRGNYKRLDECKARACTWLEAREYHELITLLIKRKRLTELSFLFGFYE